MSSSLRADARIRIEDLPASVRATLARYNAYWSAGFAAEEGGFDRDDDGRAAA